MTRRTLPDRSYRNVFSYLEPILAAAHGRAWERLRNAGYSDLSPSAFFIFRYLFRHPEGEQISRLADAGGITKQSASYLIDQLEAGGYIQRSPDPADRRAQRISLTERGEGVMAVVFEGLREDDRALERRYGAERIADLREILAEVAPPAFYEAGETPVVRFVLVPVKPRANSGATE